MYYIISIAITILIYMLVPFIISLTKIKIKRKSILAIVIINGILCFILFRFIQLATGIAPTNNTSPAFIWSCVNYWLLKKKCLADSDATNNSVEENINTSSKIEMPSASKLSSYIIDFFENYHNNNTSSILCNNNVCCTDTLLFSTYVLRAMCIGKSPSQQVAENFDAAFLKHMNIYIFKTYMPINGFHAMKSERMAFYDNIFMENRNKPDVIFSVLIETFSYIIKNDYIDKEYKPFTSDSPLPIMDIFAEVQLNTDIKNYIDKLIKNASKYLRDVEKDLKSKQ